MVIRGGLQQVRTQELIALADELIDLMGADWLEERLAHPSREKHHEKSVRLENEEEKGEGRKKKKKKKKMMMMMMMMMILALDHNAPYLFYLFYQPFT